MLNSQEQVNPGWQRRTSVCTVDRLESTEERAYVHWEDVHEAQSANGAWSKGGVEVVDVDEGENGCGVGGC